jgi:hypothetical protein
VRLDHVFDDLRGDATKMLMRKSDGQFGKVAESTIYEGITGVLRAERVPCRLPSFGVDRGRTHPIKFLPGQVGGHA